MSQTQPGSIFQIPSDESSGTMVGILQANAGQRVTAEFVIGTEDTTARSGILASASPEYLVLQDPETGNSTVCDIRTLQFVRFLSAQTDTDASADKNAAQPNAAIGSVQPVSQGYRSSQSQAAFNYARRKSQRLE